MQVAKLEILALRKTLVSEIAACEISKANLLLSMAWLTRRWVHS